MATEFRSYDLVPASGITIQGSDRVDLGKMEFPPFLDSVNLVDEFAQSGEELPSGMRQLLREADFHRVVLDANLIRPRTAEGAKHFNIYVRLDSSRDPSVEPAIFSDVGPDTKWKPGRADATVDVTISYELVGKLLKLVKIAAPIPIPEGKVAFKYSWAMKVGAVISGHAGLTANWELNRSDNDWLDGGHQFIMLIRRAREISQMSLRVEEARVDFEKSPVPGRDPWLVLPAPINIPINFNASAPVSI